MTEGSVNTRCPVCEADISRVEASVQRQQLVKVLAELQELEQETARLLERPSRWRHFRPHLLLALVGLPFFLVALFSRNPSILWYWVGLSLLYVIVAEVDQHRLEARAATLRKKRFRIHNDIHGVHMSAGVVKLPF